MNPSALLRYNWKPSILRLCVAALEDGGPCGKRAWAVRSGVPDNHLLPAVREAERLGVMAVEQTAEGMRLLVQPCQFWRERELAGLAEWTAAWRVTGKAPVLGLVTEAPGIAEALAVNLPGKTLTPALSHPMGEGGPPDRNPVGQPDSGDPTGIRSVVPLNVQRLTPSEKILSAFNVERSEGTGIRSAAERAGWLEPETEAEALEACAALLGGAAEMRAWGGRWRNRWRQNPAGLRKVLNMVREDQANGRIPKPGSNWGRFASDLWERFVEVRA